jgi:hypothetical protein
MRAAKTTYSNGDKARHAVGSRTASQAEGRRKQIPQSANRTSTRNAQTKAALRCYGLKGLGHFAREYSTREQGNYQQRGRTRNSSGKGNRANTQDRKKVGRTLGINLSCAITD